MAQPPSVCHIDQRLSSIKRLFNEAMGSLSRAILNHGDAALNAEDIQRDIWDVESKVIDCYSACRGMIDDFDPSLHLLHYFSSQSPSILNAHPFTLVSILLPNMELARGDIEGLSKIVEDSPIVTLHRNHILKVLQCLFNTFSSGHMMTQIVILFRESRKLSLGPQNYWSLADYLFCSTPVERPRMGDEDDADSDADCSCHQNP